jgi:hypothetical protein
MPDELDVDHLQVDHHHHHHEDSENPMVFVRKIQLVFFLNSSRSPSHRTKRSSPDGRRPPNEVHRENPIPSACLGVFGLSQYTTERDLKGWL